jgi:ubiquinol-cytochrome c reductase cytochrome b subunit
VVGRAQQEGALVIRKAVRVLDERTATAPFLKKALRYAFPDHWSFLLGEVALYSFVLLVLTGIYLTFFFDPSVAHQAVYHGSYEPLRGQQMTPAYKSVVDLSLDVKAGLLIRQTHHWAADVFIVAIVLHVFRIFFTGAYRKPRELTYFVGIAMLMLALLEGYLGYSLADDLLSGMGLAIGYGVAMSIPFVGANLAALIWGAPFPGAPAFWSRMYITHVLIVPVVIGVLLVTHIVLITLRHHTQFTKSEQRVVGLPAFPSYAPRTLSLMLGVFGVLFLLGGLVQINPIWLWGPYHVAESTNGAQPDWYLGWLIGALRLMPGFDVTIGNYTLVPNPFWGGVLFPIVVFTILFLWPWLERRATGDEAFHNVLDRPRDAPWRTALGVALVVWVFVAFVAGALDRAYVTFGIDYVDALWAFRVLVWLLPLVALLVTHRVCVELQRGELVRRRREEALATPPGASRSP